MFLLPFSQAYRLTAPKVMPQALLLTRGAFFVGDRRLQLHFFGQILCAPTSGFTVGTDIIRPKDGGQILSAPTEVEGG